MRKLLFLLLCPIAFAQVTPVVHPGTPNTPTYYNTPTSIQPAASGSTLIIPSGASLSAAAGGTITATSCPGCSFSSAAWGTIIGTLSNQTDLQNALNLKAPLASPVFTGTVGGITSAMVGLGNVTNDVQTQAAIVPNIVPSPGQLLAGNAAGTAYIRVSMNGDCSITSTGAVTCLKSNGNVFASGAFFSAYSLPAATSSTLGGVKPDGTSILNSSGAISVTPTSIGIGNVTNNTQTQATIVPNTAPSAGQVLIGNAGGTAYAPKTLSGSCTLASTGVITCSGGTFAGLTPGTNTSTTPFSVAPGSVVGGGTPNFSFLGPANDTNTAPVVNIDTGASSTQPAFRVGVQGNNAFQVIESTGANQQIITGVCTPTQTGDLARFDQCSVTAGITNFRVLNLSSSFTGVGIQSETETALGAGFKLYSGRVGCSADGTCAGGSEVFNVLGDGTVTGSGFTGTNTSVAGFVNWGQGTKPASATTAITETAPTLVTSYFLVKPGAAATGLLHWSNSAGTVTESVSGVAIADLTATGTPSSTTYLRGDNTWATTAGGSVFPVTVSGTVTSGAIPYFSSTTNEATSALLAANGLMIGGGVGTAPSTLSVGATGTVLIGNTAAAPSFSATPVVTSIGTGTPPTCTAGTGGVYCAGEGTAATTGAAVDILYGDSTLHDFGVLANGGVKKLLGSAIGYNSGSISASVGSTNIATSANFPAGQYVLDCDVIVTAVGSSPTLAVTVGWTGISGTPRTKTCTTGVVTVSDNPVTQTITSDGSSPITVTQTLAVSTATWQTMIALTRLQ